MTQDEAFLQAIIDEPDDDTLRLVYADCLEEHDQQEWAQLRPLFLPLSAG
jgi:uncharacterized protein (TIGR02996 family)